MVYYNEISQEITNNYTLLTVIKIEFFIICFNIFFNLNTI